MMCSPPSGNDTTTGPTRYDGDHTVDADLEVVATEPDLPKKYRCAWAGVVGYVPIPSSTFSIGPYDIVPGRTVNELVPLETTPHPSGVLANVAGSAYRIWNGVVGKNAGSLPLKVNGPVASRDQPASTHAGIAVGGSTDPPHTNACDENVTATKANSATNVTSPRLERATMRPPLKL